MAVDRDTQHSSHSSPDPWEAHAAWWQREFTGGVDPEYTEQILPLVVRELGAVCRAGGVVLDLGCGEGQVARVLSEAGAVVVGVDGALAQLAVGVSLGGGPEAEAVPAYVQGSATAVPLADGSMDAVVVSLVFEHVPDFATALAEVARVLRPGGRFLFLLNHPLLQTPDSGWVDDHLVDPPEQYWRLGPYLDEAETVEEVSKGVFVTFHHRPLSSYLNGARSVGFVLERFDEPPPPPGFLALAPEYLAAASVPRLLALTFVRT